MRRHGLLGALAGVAAALCAASAPAQIGGQARLAADDAVPHYAHVFVIVEENKDYQQILDPDAAPHISALASAYGSATQFFSEVHPSEANYVALLAGDTFGIHDDDAFYCRPGPSTDPFCAGSGAPDYVDHTIRAPHLGALLQAKGLDWKGYFENLPEPGSLAVTASDPAYDDHTRSTALYASKHSGFVNFEDVQKDPARASHLVGFDALYDDLKSGRLPAFALIVPNQCNEMHGLKGEKIPDDCDGSKNLRGLIRRGDAEVGRLVSAIQAAKAWRSEANFAIVVTFDEGSGKTREGCCGVTPGETSNFGGGHIPTIVITNHGPRGVADSTPYSHYSLLRTLEDAFGLRPYLRHAADTDHGVRPMVKLFATGQGA